ncbi:MAG: universal stress protein [Burkholderiaceae bacterium]
MTASAGGVGLPSSERKVLACVDQSRHAEYVADYAAWAARRLGAPLEFLHVIDRHPEVSSGADHSGAIGIDAQELLLSELTREESVRSKAAREAGRVFLNGLRERAIAAGIPAPDGASGTVHWWIHWSTRRSRPACSCWVGAVPRPRRRSVIWAAMSRSSRARSSGPSSPSPRAFANRAAR